MRVFVGQTRARWLTAQLAHRGWGECTCRGELPPRRSPWFYDNGAFRDWKAERPFDSDAFVRDLEAMQEHNITPEWIVTPDLVAGGARSLDYSMGWLDRVADVAPAYLAVQDGMSPNSVEALAGQYAGLFIGGTKAWKWKTADDWVSLGRQLGMPVHCGRVGSGRAARLAREIGLDSVDSSVPLWSVDNLRRFEDGLNDGQMPLPWGRVK